MVSLIWSLFILPYARLRQLHLGRFLRTTGDTSARIRGIWVSMSTTARFLAQIIHLNCLDLKLFHYNE